MPGETTIKEKDEISKSLKRQSFETLNCPTWKAENLSFLSQCCDSATNNFNSVD